MLELHGYIHHRAGLNVTRTLLLQLNLASNGQRNKTDCGGTPNTLVVSTISFFALTLFLQKTQREDISASELCVSFGTIHRPVKSGCGSVPGFAARRCAVSRWRSSSAVSSEPTGEEAVKRTRDRVWLGRARGRRLRVRRGSGSARVAGRGVRGGGRRPGRGPRGSAGMRGAGAGAGATDRAREAEMALGRPRRGADVGPGRRGRAAPPRRLELGLTLAQSPWLPSLRSLRAARVGSLEVLRLCGWKLSEEPAVCRVPG